MTVHYGEALEQQLALQRWLQDGRNWITLDRLPLTEKANIDGPRFPIDKELLSFANRGLDSGEPYFWGKGPSDVLERTAPYFPDWVLEPEMMPTRTGFVWFERSLALPSTNGTDARLAAMSWCPSPHDVHLIVTFFWNVGHWSGVPMVFSGWTWGKPWYEVKAAHTKRGGTANGQTGRQRIIRCLEYFSAALAFLNQKIMTVSPERVTRRTSVASRPTSQAARLEPTVRVVHLRRSEESGTSRAGATREWHSQWFVRAHWHTYLVGPKHGQRQPRFILPHIKGDPSKPLKPPRTTIFAVVR